MRSCDLQNVRVALPVPSRSTTREKRNAMLRAKEASALCGYVPTTINHWVNRGLVQAVRCYGQNYISKQSLAEYLSSRAGQQIAVKTEAHRALLREVREETT